MLTFDTLSSGRLGPFHKLPGRAEQAYVTYCWIDGTGEYLRAKSRYVEKESDDVEDLDMWHFDGSSTYQATGGNSDLLLQPVYMANDPFFPTKGRIALCEVLDSNGEPIASNHRRACAEADKLTKAHKPWFGFEQEYVLLGVDGRPLGFPSGGYPPPQGPYYCSVGAGRSFGRDCADAHMIACRYAGLKHGGTNAEVLLGQWEYQMGPLSGLELADQVWLSRFILWRVAEEFGIDVTLDVKPVSGDWNGSGAHINFSTEPMRGEDGLKHIWAAIEKMRPHHKHSMSVYDPNGGEDNKRRMTGRHETAAYDVFSAAVGARNVSIRIPRNVALAGKGHMEDRRPASNADPYQVVNAILRQTLM